MEDMDLEANRARARAWAERLEADPEFVANVQRAMAEMDAGLYYAWDPDNGFHTDLPEAVDGCECLACKKHRS